MTDEHLQWLRYGTILTAITTFALWGRKVKDVVQLLSVPAKFVYQRMVYPSRLEANLNDIATKMVNIESKMDRLITEQWFNRELIWLEVTNGSMSRFEANAHGEWTRVSRNLCTLCRRTEEQLLQSNWMSCIVVEDRDVVCAEWTRCINQARDFEMSVKFYRNDHSIVILDVRTRSIRDINGKLLAMAGSAYEQCQTCGKDVANVSAGT